MTYPSQHGAPYIPGTMPPNADWQPPAPKNRLLPWLIAALVVAVVAVGILIAALAAGGDKAVGERIAGNAVVEAVTDPGPTLAKAKTQCDPPDGRGGVSLHDGNKTLIIDTLGEEDSVGASTTTLYCVLNYLEAPAAVIEHMDSTRALDGRQTSTWESFSAGWTYHPDDGMDLTIQQR